MCASTIAEAIASAVGHPVGAGDAAYRTGVAHQRRFEVDTVPFGCFRRATWEEIGGFNEALLTNKDYEFNYRVRSGGRAVVLDPGMRCEYFARGTLRDLAAQDFRYGWWKAMMLKRRPGAIRWRQAVPAALVPVVAVLAVLSLAWPGAAQVLTGLALVYLATVAASAVHISIRCRRWSLLVSLVAAFVIIHVAWSAGFSVSVATGGRWPIWRARTTSPKLGGQQGFTALTLLLALLATLILTLVVPPGVATLVNRSRIARAQAGAEALAEALRGLARTASSRRLSGNRAMPRCSGATTWAREFVSCSLAVHVVDLNLLAASDLNLPGGTRGGPVPRFNGRVWAQSTGR